MHKTNKRAFTNFQKGILDILSIVFAFYISYFVARNITTLKNINAYDWSLLMFVPIYVLSMAVQKMYNMTTFKYFDRIFRHVIFSVMTAIVYTMATIFLIEKSLFLEVESGLDRSLLVNNTFVTIFVVTCTSLLLVQKYLYIYVQEKFFLSGLKKIIVIGIGDVPGKFLHYLNKTEIQFNIVQRIPLCDEKGLWCPENDRVLKDLGNKLKEQVIDEVIFAVPSNFIKTIEEYASIYQVMGITVRIVFDMDAFEKNRIMHSSIGNMPMMTLHSVCLNKDHVFIKRIMDIIGGTIGVIIMSLLSIFIIPAIKLESKGSVFFKQKRVGMNGRIFHLYKFRSMVADAEDKKKDLMSQNAVSGDLMFKMKNDPRITRVGKFLRDTSLDELPQFINVLKGDMSLVGTRPPTLDEVSRYDNHHRRRISIKPGITGMWQISGRSNITNFDEVVRLDTEYIDKWSVWLDIKILLKTIFVVFKRKGAF